MSSASEIQSFPLTEEGIGEILSTLESFFISTKSDVVNAEELRKAVVYVLQTWQNELGEGKICKIQKGKRLARPYITLSVVGDKVVLLPHEIDESLQGGGNSVSTLFTGLGLTPSFQYVNGENQLTITPNKKKINPLIPILIAAAAAILIGLFCNLLPMEMKTSLVETLVKPLFNVFVGILVAVAVPMMFLALMWGIYSIGDLATLSSLGKSIIGRYIGRIFFSILVCLAISIPFFSIVFTFDTALGNPFAPFFEFILSIIPSNFITPFVEVNTLQIIFMAVLFGVALLILNKKIPECVKVVGQLNMIVQLIMEWIIKLLPVLIFLGILNILLTLPLSELLNFWQLFANIILCSVVLVFLMLATFSIRLKVSFFTVFKKLLPTFIMAVSSVSSVATFPTNLKVCRESFGVDEKLSYFGAPLGAVFSHTGYGVVLFCTALYMGSMYGIEMNLTWIIMAVIVSGLLGIAAPPVAGGGIVVFSLLFVQLGIPMEAMTFAVILSILLDFIITPLNTLAVPIDLATVAKKSKMINLDVLRSRTSGKKNK